MEKNALFDFFDVDQKTGKIDKKNFEDGCEKLKMSKHDYEDIFTSIRNDLGIYKEDGMSFAEFQEATAHKKFNKFFTILPMKEVFRKVNASGQEDASEPDEYKTSPKCVACSNEHYAVGFQGCKDKNHILCGTCLARRETKCAACHHEYPKSMNSVKFPTYHVKPEEYSFVELQPLFPLVCASGDLKAVKYGCKWELAQIQSVYFHFILYTSPPQQK